MERAFSAYIDSSEHSTIDFNELIQNNILTENPVAACSVAPIIQCPSQSALEDSSSAHKFHLRIFLEVCALVSSTKWQLKTHPLKNILDRLVVYRRDRVDAPELGMAESTEQRLLDAAHLFRHVRPYVPIETSCLLDSLSMIKFLSRRRLFSTLVFGVALEPFLAHCWIQYEGLILNDLIGTTTPYTPIKVI
jgi:hypothetical protein